MKRNNIKQAASLVAGAALMCSLTMAAVPACAVWIEVPPVTITRAIRSSVFPLVNAIRRAAADNSPSARSWTDIPVIAHAMGTVDGRIGTNCKDAFLESYARGQRVFEVDLQLTSDGVMVARHDWDTNSNFNMEQSLEGVADWKTFMSTPVCYYYSPLDIDGIIDLMLAYPDVYIVTDGKDTDEASVRAQVREIVRAVNQAGDPSLWDRIIIQIYHEEMYDWVKAEAPVKNWIFTLYQIGNPDYDEIGRFCQERDIPVVTIDAARLAAENSRILHSYGRLVYTHTVNRLSSMAASSLWADGFYSDYVTPAQLKGVLNNNYGQYSR
ncbi:MAG: hypothetical protein HFF44_06010 [Lawsonibacter sp.]|nr:hypothetical protein [Lawsonibacter sp.]